MIKISIFSKIFGRFQNDNKVYNSFNLTSSSTAAYGTFNKSIYESAVTRSCIHAIANNAAKFKPTHMLRDTSGAIKKPTNNKVNNIIADRPNPLMSAFDFYYKLITQLYNKNNAFALIERGMNQQGIEGLYPINYNSVEGVEYNNEVFLKFQLCNGNMLTIPYNDCIHLRRFYYDKELFGEDNQALYPTLQVIETTNQGIEEGVKSSAILRGILKFSTMLKADDMKKQRDTFITDYLDISNNGGVAATDSKMDYVPLTSAPILINAIQMKAIREQVYLYFNVNEKFVTNEWTEDGWNAVYESVLEPLAIQMSQEFRTKIFNDNLQARGNDITFDANRLAYASNKTKIQFVKEVGILGAITLNEVREIFNLSPIEGGEKRVQTLNVVNAETADQYQNGGDTDVEDENNTET